MRSFVLKYGLIGGAIVLILGVSMMSLIDSVDFDTMELIGYGIMAFGLAFIYIGVKMYRDKGRDGIINFKTAFLTGLYIGLIISSLYVLGWFFTYDPNDTSFATRMKEAQTSELLEQGQTSEYITIKNKEFDKMMVYYNEYAILRIILTLLEILPLALITALLTGLILKKEGSTF